MRESLVAEQRHYAARTVADAKRIARGWLLERIDLARAVVFGLPEVDDRYHIWRVPLLAKATEQVVGEVVIDAHSTLIVSERTTSRAVLEARAARKVGAAGCRCGQPERPAIRWSAAEYHYLRR